jgi:hypothetical protein
MSKKFITSPIGIAVFPHLEKPDTFKGQNHYKLNLELPKDVAEVFKAKLQEMIKDEKFETKKPKLPFREGRDESVFLISAKSQYKPVIYDSHKNPISARVGGGSKVRFIAEVYNYGEGISLRLNQVQVVDLKEQSSCAFDDIEDGYTTDSEDNYVPTTKTTSTSELSALDL